MVVGVQLVLRQMNRLLKFIIVLPLVLLFCGSCFAIKPKVFCFYYNWYQTKAFDGADQHWSHWSNGNPTGYPGGDNIGANFFPSLGNYSTNDPVLVAKHMKMIAKAGINAVFLTWWGKDHFTAKSIPVILDEAKKAGVKVGFQIEPYGNRSPLTVKADVKYLIDTYGKHPAFYYSEQKKPLFFVYDSYLSKATEWSDVLSPAGSSTIRKTLYDADFMGLWVNDNEHQFFKDSGFDGFYTYFVSKVFRYGSNPNNWAKMQEWAVQNNKIFIPCVGPGYIDERIRPENSANTQSRDNGAYYDDYWKKAIAVKSPYVAITSFNEWHEGTQIEPAKPLSITGFTYLDYSPLANDYYITRTRYWTDRFLKK
jgi:glycoprotein endo-alpha-1,2-mannosidase